MKTRYCEDCRFADMRAIGGMACMRGHKPRFYMPKGTYPHYDSGWGWKRKCADFKAGTPKGITVHRIDLSFQSNGKDLT